ncbi:MAG: PhoU domain-containing protein, partial [Candidatus Syntropharchaeia archaeon]
QSLLNYEDFPFEKTIRSMYAIAKSMCEDGIAALENGDSFLARDVIQRDNEVDRFYLLAVRQLKAAVRNSEIAKRMGIKNQLECMGYRLIAKSIERIGDHAEKIAMNVTQMESNINVEEISKLGEFAIEIFSAAMKSLSRRDIKEANEVIERANRGVEEGIRVGEEFLRSEIDAMEKIRFWSILESLRRITEYGADIAEIIMNMGIEIPET